MALPLKKIAASLNFFFKLRKRKEKKGSIHFLYNVIAILLRAFSIILLIDVSNSNSSNLISHLLITYLVVQGDQLNMAVFF